MQLPWSGDSLAETHTIVLGSPVPTVTAVTATVQPPRSLQVERDEAMARLEDLGSSSSARGPSPPNRDPSSSSRANGAGSQSQQQQQLGGRVGSSGVLGAAGLQPSGSLADLGGRGAGEDGGTGTLESEGTGGGPQGLSQGELDELDGLLAQFAASAAAEGTATAGAGGEQKGVGAAAGGHSQSGRLLFGWQGSGEAAGGQQGSTLSAGE